MEQSIDIQRQIFLTDIYDILTGDYERSDNGDERNIRQRTLETVSLQILSKTVAIKASEARNQ